MSKSARGKNLAAWRRFVCPFSRCTHEQTFSPATRGQVIRVNYVWWTQPEAPTSMLTNTNATRWNYTMCFLLKCLTFSLFPPFLIFLSLSSCIFLRLHWMSGSARGYLRWNALKDAPRCIRKWLQVFVSIMVMRRRRRRRRVLMVLTLKMLSKFKRNWMFFVEHQASLWSAWYHS